jgi:ketosteroid isomerase-like protein
VSPVGTTDALSVVEAFGAAWADHNLDAAMDFVTEDCVFDNTDPAPDGTRYVGHAAIRSAWTPIFEDPSSRFETEDAFSTGDRVVQLWRYSWSNGHVRGVDVFRVRDGKIAEKFSYVKG